MPWLYYTSNINIYFSFILFMWVCCVFYNIKYLWVNIYKEYIQKSTIRKRCPMRGKNMFFTLSMAYCFYRYNTNVLHQTILL